MLLAGHTINHYRIEKDLNFGQFAISYQATDQRDGKDVFFKEYTDPTSFQGALFDQFVKQQRYMTGVLRGIEVAETIYETFEEDGRHYQAKQFMVGKPLDSFLEDGPSLKERLVYASVFLYALRKVHAAGIVHGDLKPQQVYLSRNPSVGLGFDVRIVDFDFCWVPGKFKPIYRVHTPYFQSPEHVRGEDVVFASDGYTAGLMLCDILCNVHPVKAELYAMLGPSAEIDAAELEERVGRLVIAGAPKPAYEYVPADLRDLWPRDLLDLVHQLLRPTAASRPTLETVHRALLDHISALEGSPAPAPRPTPKPEDAKVAKPEESMPPRPPVPAPPVEKAAERRVPIRVELHASRGSMYLSYHKDSVVARADGKLTGDTNYKFMAGEQFELKKSAEGWVIVGRPGTPNATLLKDRELGTMPELLSEGDVIKVGNLASGNLIEFKVKLIYED